MQTVVAQTAQYGVNYGPGWTGFISRRHDFVAAGIDWFSRWDEISGVPVSHTFKIVGPDGTVEALQGGVQYGRLSDYLQNPDVALLVRQPRCLSPNVAGRLCRTVAGHVGEPYNDRLIAALATANTVSGRLLNRLSGGGFQNWLCKRADRPGTWICSKLETTTFQSVGAWRGLGGVVRRLACTVKPIDLFEDVYLFKAGATELLAANAPAKS